LRVVDVPSHDQARHHALDRNVVDVVRDPADVAVHREYAHARLAVLDAEARADDALDLHQVGGVSLVDDQCGGDVAVLGLYVRYGRVGISRKLGESPQAAANTAAAAKSRARVGRTFIDGPSSGVSA
jgi:hypothetical protein